MYWSHFGLERQPFRPAVDPDAYFSSPSHDEALSAIADGFARRDPVVLIDGGPGVGKSVVARKWLEHLLPDVPRVFLPSVRADDPSALLQAILFDLAAPYQGLSEQELRLGATALLLESASASGYPLVLVLDEAQNLSLSALEELRLLGNLETRRGSAVFCVMVAQPKLRERLQNPAQALLAQRVAVQVAIEPLTAQESADYLRHQVCSAGGEPARLFDDGVVDLLAEACGGIPRILNRAASLAFELAASTAATQVDYEAALEALTRLGLTPEDPEDAGLPEAEPAVLLPHPARTVESAASGKGKSQEMAARDEESQRRGPKERASRKRSV